MAEFRYVNLPVKSGKTGSAQVADLANAELAEYVADGWEPLTAVPGAAIGQIGFLLRR